MEIWKDIKDYEGLYRVSNRGRIMSLKHWNGNDKKYCSRERILNPEKTKQGYLRATLCKDKKHKRFQVHRLVAEAFIPNPHNYPLVLHKKAVSDGGTNYVDNLYWGTHKQNRADCMRDGHQNDLRKRTLQYDKQGNFIKEWESQTEASRQLNIQFRDISNCCLEKRKTAGRIYLEI